MKPNNLIEHISLGTDESSFVGLKYIGNDIHLYYPEAYSIDFENDEWKSDVLDLIKTISIAKKKSSDNENVYNKTDSNIDFALFSYMWIIKDYLQNGFYVNREKLYKINQKGRVNWKRTLQTQPIISNGNIIYKDIVVDTKNNLDNVMVEIHKYCVKKSIDLIGWLFNLNSSFIEKITFNDGIKKIYLSVLNKELNLTFDDDKRNRLMHMKNVIQGLDTSEEKQFVYGVDKYYYIYERMIDSIFSSGERIQDFYPKAKWKLIRPEIKEKDSSNLRPDTILLKDDSVYILDAKFYRFGVTANIDDLPNTSSIQKQITYGDFVKNNKSKKFDQVKNIYNAFLIPYNKFNNIFNSKEDLLYIGNAETDWKDKNNSHDKVHAFLIDLKHVIKTWNSYNHNDDINKLIEDILKYSKEKED